MTSTTLAPYSPATVPDQVREQMRDLLEVIWAARTPTELLGVVAGIEKLRSVMDAVQLRVIEEIEATDAAKTDGWASAKDFVTAICGGRYGDGASAVRLAQALGTDRARVGEELANARISRLQAQVIVRTIEALPVQPGLRAAAEEAMIEHAHTLDASDLAKVGKHLIEILDPDGDEREQERKLSREERAAHLNRFLSMTDDGAGGVKIKGATTVEDAAAIKAALFALAAPTPSTPGACGGTPIAARVGAARVGDHTGTGDSGAGHTGTGENPGAGEQAGDGVGTPTGACGIPGCAHDGSDPRDHGARFLDAFVEGCRRLLSTEVLPESHGAPARLNLTMDYADLSAGIGAATLDTGETLSPSTSRRLACDADLIPMVLGSHGEILDVGRLQRLVTTGIWLALVVRDRHCTFPGCHRPPIACDAHHIIHWLEGGPTSLHNLALLCRAHHRLIHNTPWEIRLNPIDKEPEFIPPARLDPEQKPIRARQPRA